MRVKSQGWTWDRASEFKAAIPAAEGRSAKALTQADLEKSRCLPERWNQSKFEKHEAQKTPVLR